MHKSHGMETTLKRIELWNKEHEVSRGVEILDKVPAEHGESGTGVVIFLACETDF